MKFKNVRVATALTAFGLVIALAGLIAPTALGAGGDSFRFVTQPADAEKNATITSSDLAAGTNFVQVELVDANGVRVTNSNLVVTFTLATGTLVDGQIAATGDLDPDPQPLIDGVATFGSGTLSIGTLNEPQFTSYALIPKNTKGPKLPGDTSSGFDVWEDGDVCTGGGDECIALLRGGRDEYKLNADGSLGASRLTGVLQGLVCPKQKLVFSNSVFSWATTEDDGVTNVPVSLSTTITRAEWRASANNGQAHADWCIGLEEPDAWDDNGANYTQRDTDLDGDLDLYVALAPNCPVSNPSASAPCIVSQNPDGLGGSLTTGWLPGGDPPRKT